MQKRFAKFNGYRNLILRGFYNGRSDVTFNIDYCEIEEVKQWLTYEGVEYEIITSKDCNSAYRSAKVNVFLIDNKATHRDLEWN